jgi:hypothetical protein
LPLIAGTISRGTSPRRWPIYCWLTSDQQVAQNSEAYSAALQMGGAIRFAIAPYVSRQQFRRYTQHRPGVGQALIQRLHRSAMLRGEGKMQRLAGAESECVLIDELCGRSEVSASHRQHRKTLDDQSAEHGQRSRALFRICKVRSFIAKVEDISVMVQSLIRSCAGSCSASQSWTYDVIAAFESVATISDVSR